MLNQVTLIGRLGADPEIKNFEGGNKVATLSVATWESYWDKNKANEQTGQPGAWETVTEWHRVNVWGDRADRVTKMQKGDVVMVTGKIKTRNWDGQDGQKHYATEIVGFVKAMPRANAGAATANNEQYASAPPVAGPGPEPDDDLPF